MDFLQLVLEAEYSQFIISMSHKTFNQTKLANLHQFNKKVKPKENNDWIILIAKNNRTTKLGDLYFEKTE